MLFRSDVATGPAGAVYIADLNNNRIRQVTTGASIVAVNAASLQPGPVAPGMLVAIRGDGLRGSQVLFDAIPAPVLASDDSGLVVQAPPQIAGSSSIQINILFAGHLFAQLPMTVVAASPALFAAANEDGTVNSPGNPAARGSGVALYGTGEGVSGLPIAAQVGGFPADVLYAGPVAGYPGLLQVNVRIPAGYVAAGDMTATITVGGISSQPGVTIAVN